MANAFASGYSKRKYRGFVSNDALKENRAKLITGHKRVGTDVDGKAFFEDDVQADFDDFRLASIGNTFQKEWKEKVNASALTEFIPYASNPTISPAGSEDLIFINSVFKDGDTYHLFYAYNNATDERVIGHATSANGKSWTKDAANNPILEKGSAGKFDEKGILAAVVWKEGSGSGCWRMLYTGRNNSNYQSIGYATADNPEGAWTRQNSSNAVLSGTATEWDENDVESTGVIKVGSTYYCWYSKIAVTRQTGVATSTNLTSWTKDANNPLFGSGRFMANVFKRESYYYLLISHYTSGTDYSEFELYKDSNPTFHSGDRTLLGIAKTCAASGWDSHDEDCPYPLTDDINRDSYSASGNELWMYYSGEEGGTWKVGMTTNSDIDAALLPGVSADKWFKVTKAYSSVLTSNAASGQAVVNVNNAGSFAANDWVVIARDNGTDELIQILSIASNAVTMKTNLANAYTTADSAKVMLGYYIYYKNDSEGSHQDGANTFVDFDDFEDTDFTNWTDTGGEAAVARSGTHAHNGSYSAYHVGGGVKWSGSIKKTSLNYTAHAIHAWLYNTGADEGNILLIKDENTAAQIVGLNDDTSNTKFIYRKDGGSYTAGTVDQSAGWHKVEIRASTDGIEAYVDGVLSFSAATGLECNWVELGGIWSSATTEGWFDDFFITNYPYLVGSGFGAEQENIIYLSITEALTMSETLARAYDTRPIATESLTLAETLAHAYETNPTITENLTLAETLALIGIFNSISVTEGISLAETVALIGVFNSINITENITLAETLVQAWRAFNKTITENVTLSETLVRDYIANPVITENITLSEVLSLLGIFNTITATENLTLSETLASQATTVPVITEGIALSETLATLKTMYPVVTEAVTFSEALAAALTLPLTVTENTTFSEALSAYTTMALAISESTTFSETLAVEHIKHLLATESVTLSDTLAVVGTQNITVTENITLSETLAAIFTAHLFLQKLVIKSPFLQDLVTKPAFLQDLIAKAAYIQKLTIKEGDTL